jgi:hypothetical protein
MQVAKTIGASENFFSCLMIRQGIDPSYVPEELKR